MTILASQIRLYKLHDFPVSSAAHIFYITRHLSFFRLQMFPHCAGSIDSNGSSGTVTFIDRFEIRQIAAIYLFK